MALHTYIMTHIQPQLKANSLSLPSLSPHQWMQIVTVRRTDQAVRFWSICGRHLWWLPKSQVWPQQGNWQGSGLDSLKCVCECVSVWVCVCECERIFGVREKCEREWGWGKKEKGKKKREERKWNHSFESKKKWKKNEWKVKWSLPSQLTNRR